MEQSKFYQIKNITEQEYTLVGCDGSVITRPIQDIDKSASAFTIKDAKDGDILQANKCTLIFDSLTKNIDNQTVISSWYFCDSKKFYGMGTSKPDLWDIDGVVPATKEQRDLLFQKMKEAGYEWNAEKKELKKIDNEEYNGEDYGIDSLYHAQRILEKTLGKVDGYQTDDGILSHECAITAVKKLYEQKSAENSCKNSDDNTTEEIDITEYKKGFECGKQRVLKYPEDFGLCKKPAWSEEDKKMLNQIISIIEDADGDLIRPENISIYTNWLKSLRPQNNITDEELVQAKKDAYNDALDKIEYHSGEPTFDDGWSAAIDYIRKKYLRPQQQWKPTEAQLSSLTIACNRNDIIGFDLTQLLKELKKL